MKTSKLLRVYRSFAAAAALVAALLLLTTGSARAVDGTWDGGGASAIWGGANNWVVNGAFATGVDATATFATAFGTYANSNNILINAGARTIGHINYTNASINMSISLNTSSDSFTLSATGTNSVITVANSARTLTMNCPLFGASGLAKRGFGTLILANTNAYSGSTIISAGTLTLSTNLAMQNSVLDTTASIAGTSTNGLKTTVTTLTLGGLSGNKNLADVFTTTSGGYGSVTDLRLNPGTGVSASYSGIIANGAANMTLTKLGAGTLILSGDNTYSGGTTNSGGIIIVTNSATALGTGPVTFAGGVRLVVATGLDVTNAILIGANSGGSGRGLIEAGTTNGTAIISGPITINNPAAAGGTFAAPTAGTVLRVAGPITSITNVSSRIGTVEFAGGGTGYTTLINNEGTARVGAANGIATSANVSVGASNPGLLDLNGFNQSLAGITAGGSAANATITNSTTTPATLTLTGTSSYAGVIKDDGGLGKVNLTVSGGNVTLSGVNTYSGATTISAGKLTFSTAGSAASDVTVASGATNGVLVAAPNGQWVNSGSLTNDNNSLVEVNYGSTVPSTTTAPIKVNNYSVGTGLTLKVVGLGFSAGQDYPLVTWIGSGPANTNGFANLDLPTSPAVTGYLTVSGNTLYLHVVTVAALSWNTGDGDWDTTSVNWTNTALNVAAAYTDVPADAVLFGDAAGATGNPSVNLTNAFSPLSVQMNSSSHDYTITNTLSGTGNIGGSGPLILDAANTRTLTLATSNSYTGGTVVSGGTLALSGEGTLGSTAGSLMLSGGRFDLGGLTGSKGAVSITTAAATGDTITNGTLTATSYVGSNTNGNAMISAILGGAGTFTKTGAGTVTLAGANTYSGATAVSEGILALTGNRTAQAFGVTVGNVTGKTGTLNVTDGTFTAGTSGSTFQVGSGTGSTGIMNQSGGSLTTIGNQLLIGSGTGTGTYNLSGGTLTTITGTLGVTIGVNNTCTGTFTLSGTGTLTMPATSTMQVARSDGNTVTNSTGTFSQTGGTATVGILRMGGAIAASANGTATLNLSGGTFSAVTFNALSVGNFSTSSIAISGSANVTLPAFPTTRGTNSAATITFDGGTLSPLAASAAYMGGLTSAKIKAGGASVNVDSGKNITITQALLTDDVSTGGGLIKSGDGVLTLSGTNTHTGVTTISAGKLAFSTVGSATTPITVAASATNGVLVATAGGQWVNTGNLTNQDNSVLEVNYGSTLPGTTTAPIQVNNYSVGTGLTLQVAGFGFSAGQDYPLVTWTGSGPADTNAFTTVILPRLTGYLTNYSSTLYLHVETVGALSWNTGNGDWDTTTPNWLDTALNLASTYTDPTDAVLFNDAAGATGDPIVNLASAFSPLRVTMNSTNHDYTISGTGGIGGSGSVILEAANARTLTLATTNTYTGGTTVNGGALNTSLGTSLNSLGTGPVSIASGATNQINNENIVNVTPVLGNTFAGSGLLKINFAANTTARNTTISGVTNFTGTIQLANLGTTGDKWSSTSLGTVAGSLLVDSGSTIYVNTAPGAFTGGITLNGAGNSEGRGAIRMSATTLGGNISLASSSTIGMESAAAAQITGNIASSAAGAHALTLGGTNGTQAGGILSGNISDGTGTIAVTNANGSYTLTGNLSHSGGVNVTGGLLTLSGTNNTYTGVTAISAAAGRSLIVPINGALGATGTGNETTIGAAGQLGFSGGINYTATEKIIGSGAGNSGGQGVFTAGTRGFIQSVSSNNTFAGDIELSADGVSRIGTQDGAQLTLSGAITQGAGVTNASILFRSGNLAGDFVTLSNANNSFGGDSTVFSSATSGNWAGLRLGVDNAHPTNLTIANFVSSSGNATALDLNGKQQTLNGLANGGAGTLNIINLDTVNAATLTLNPTVNKTNAATIVLLGGGSLGVINLVKDGAFTQTLTGSGTLVNGYPTASNSFSGNITVNGSGTLVAAASAASSGTNLTVLGTATNSRTITVNSGATLTFSAPNVLSRTWASANVPTLVINGGTVGNADPVGSNKCNNALGNVILTNGTLSASASHTNGYGAWNINGTVTSSGSSSITSSDPTYATVQLNSAGPGLTTNYTTFNVTDGTLAISAPLAQTTDLGDARVSGLIKTGAGTLLLNGASTYTGDTVINDGTLGGTGSLAGAVTNSAGGTLSPGASIGTLTIGGNLTLNAGSTNTFEVDGTTPTNDVVVLGSAVTYGGVLNIVTNGTFTAGQTFTLFSGVGATSASSFASIQGSPGAGKAFTFTNGVLTVVSAGPVAPSPTLLTNSISGTTLTLSWPTNQNWRLEQQTNSRSVGLRTNWVDITPGSANSTNITVDKTVPTTFYRLMYP